MSCLACASRRDAVARLSSPSMTERGLPSVEGSPACPFVAFEDDRDERADRPDHRHRCYAEAVPAPRALAHQEAYCLSSAFPVCPTFQDWARRESARARAGCGRRAERRLGGPDDDDEAPSAPREPPVAWPATGPTNGARARARPPIRTMARRRDETRHATGRHHRRGRAGRAERPMRTRSRHRTSSRSGPARAWASPAARRTGSPAGIPGPPAHRSHPTPSWPGWWRAARPRPPEPGPPRIRLGQARTGASRRRSPRPPLPGPFHPPRPRPIRHPRRPANARRSARPGRSTRLATGSASANGPPRPSEPITTARPGSGHAASRPTRRSRPAPRCPTCRGSGSCSPRC